jgi:hypothetical protein
LVSTGRYQAVGPDPRFIRGVFLYFGAGGGGGLWGREKKIKNQSPSFNNTPPPRPFFISLISFPIVHHYLFQS